MKFIFGFGLSLYSYYQEGNVPISAWQLHYYYYLAPSKYVNRREHQPPG